MERTRFLCVITFLVCVASIDAQDRPEYACWKTQQTIAIDGNADGAAWQQAAPMSLWDVRCITDPKPHTYPTEARMLWDEATDYAEIEVNPLNTIVDLLVTRTPRRQSSFEWGPLLYTATEVSGTLNNPEDTDQYWSMELAMRWEVLSTDISDVVGDRSLPPLDGDMWRFNSYRYERIRENGAQTGNIGYSAWSPTGKTDSHMPERFGIVTFREGQTAVARSS